MKKIKTTLYICDGCRKPFQDKNLCEQHEKVCGYLNPSPGWKHKGEQPERRFEANK